MDAEDLNGSPRRRRPRGNVALWRLLVALLVVGFVACRRSSPRLSQHSDGELEAQPPSACSSDAWCRTSPYLPEVRTAGSPTETWQLVDRTQLFRKRAGEPWRRIPFPPRFGTALASAGQGKVWVLSPHCQVVVSIRNLSFGREAECTETTVHVYDGRAWSAQTLPNHVYAIWAASPTDVWAVGGNDRDPTAPVQIHRWDGSNWVPMVPKSRNPKADTSNKTGPLRDVAGTSPSDVWFTGGETIVHWDGSALLFSSLDFMSASLGYHEGGSPSHFKESRPRPKCNYDEIVLSGGRVGLLPGNLVTSYCPLQEFDVPGRFREVTPGTRPDLDRIVDKRTNLRTSLSNATTSSFARPGRDIHSVAVVGRNDISASAAGGLFYDAGDRMDPGVVVGLAGKTWREWASSLVSRWCYDSLTFPPQLIFDGESFYSFGGYSFPSKLVDGKWRDLQRQEWPLAAPEVCALWSAPGLPILVANGKGLELWNGAQRTKAKFAAHFETSPSALWASAADDAWLATLPCDESLTQRDRQCPARLYHFDGHAITPFPDSAIKCTYRAIHGARRDDIWLAGDRGCMAHFDGRAWSTVSSGTTTDLRAVATCGGGDAWAVGDQGTILHWNGISWNPMESGTGQDLLAIAGCGSGLLWAVGRSGTILSRAEGDQAQSGSGRRREVGRER